MENATIIDGIAYHSNRYGERGLYGIDDPAERIHQQTGIRFMDAYPPLQHKGTALIKGCTLDSMRGAAPHTLANSQFITEREKHL
jgi:hypothetical protein